MQNRKAVILFLRPATIDRTKFSGVYAGLPWTELDALFTAIFHDTVESLSDVPHVDIFIFHDNTEWSGDFINAFLKTVKVGEVRGESFFEQVGHALEQVTSAGYKKIILFFENHPLINKDLIMHVFDLLSHEDEYAVVGQMLDGNIHFLGLRYEHADLFDESEKNTDVTLTSILRLLCKKETMVFQVDTLYSLDSSFGLQRLYRELQDLELLHRALPRRTHTFFRSLDKTYRLTKEPS